jgi:hypothetical protein
VDPRASGLGARPGAASREGARGHPGPQRVCARPRRENALLRGEVDRIAMARAGRARSTSWGLDCWRPTVRPRCGTTRPWA